MYAYYAAIFSSYINIIRYTGAYFQFVKSEIIVFSKRLEHDRKFIANDYEVENALREVIIVHQKALRYHIMFFGT